jgi:long-chain acyl-CoA synthetase
VVPFFHSYGLSACVMNGVALGATIVMHHRFRPDAAVRLIERHRPTALFALPRGVVGHTPTGWIGAQAGVSWGL